MPILLKVKRYSRSISFKGTLNVHIIKCDVVARHANRRTRFHCKCECIPGTRTAAPQAGSKRSTHWTSETVNWSEAAAPPQYQNIYRKLPVT